MVDWSVALAEHQRWLRTSLFARLVDFQAVDEVMQEVSLAACSRKEPLRDPDKAGAWLYRVSLRQAMLFRRRKGRQARLLDRLGQHNRSRDQGPGPLDFLLRQERGQLVRDAMEKLDARDREILLLRYTQDWSSREMATHLGVSVACVEARLHRARQRLRLELQSSFHT